MCIEITEAENVLSLCQFNSDCERERNYWSGCFSAAGIGKGITSIPSSANA